MESAAVENCAKTDILTTLLTDRSGNLFGFVFFLGSLFILQLTNFNNGDRKQERRRKSIPHSVEKAQRPARIDFQQFRSNKSQILPCIRTLLPRTECNFSTACAITAARQLAQFPNECRAITISRV